MKKILEGSRAIAETIKNIGVDVVSCYPITPQTHIVEDLAKFKADGEADYEYVRAESEFAAMSILVGASAAGARTYTATSSQGLLLMTEVLYNVAGMRLPIVMTDANRAISAPINIWNDQQDAVTVRDAGWIMLYGENNQEVCDLHVLAYKIAEACQIPVMVNLDGFVLTHTLETIEIIDSKSIKKYLPAFKPSEKLDPKDPLTFGAFATPKHYMEIRQELHDDVVASKKMIAKEMTSFKKYFGRKLSLVDYYGDKSADTVVVAMGSVLGTIKDAIDELKKSGKKVGVLKVSSLRPFPAEEIIKEIGNKKNVIVIDKSLSLGEEGILAGELKRSFYGNSKATITSVIMGLGGRDITKEMIKKAITQAGKSRNQAVFIGK
ncbi:MAG: Pyruvate synthase subunit PorA [Parcubacteria group bacterium ADurb.Bin326]|nr:MAG: Pyruvate synthase subunit PorA [Parcubacteria group bacterium ADurb.Bin326]